MQFAIVSWPGTHYVKGHEEYGKLSDWLAVVNGSNYLPLISRALQEEYWDQHCSAS